MAMEQKKNYVFSTLFSSEKILTKDESELQLSYLLAVPKEGLYVLNCDWLQICK